MDVLRSFNLLAKDLIAQEKRKHRIKIADELIDFYSDHMGIPKGRMVHFYGDPDCGKTLMARTIIKNNPHLSFLYVSGKLDDITRISGYNNVCVLNTNIFDETIEFLQEMEKDAIDVLILDDFNNMISREEVESAFTVQFDNRAILEKYIKTLCAEAAKKRFTTMVFDGINLVTQKPRYGYLMHNESVADIHLQKALRALHDVIIKATVEKNLMSQEKQEKLFQYHVLS